MVSRPAGGAFQPGAANPTTYPAMIQEVCHSRPQPHRPLPQGPGWPHADGRTMMAAATPPIPPETEPTSWKKERWSRSPVMHLCTSFNQKVAMAALAMPLIACWPFGIFRLKRENAARVRRSSPMPERMVNIFCRYLLLGFVDDSKIPDWLQEVSARDKNSTRFSVKMKFCTRNQNTGLKFVTTFDNRPPAH